MRRLNRNKQLSFFAKNVNKQLTFSPATDVGGTSPQEGHGAFTRQIGLIAQGHPDVVVLGLQPRHPVRVEDVFPEFLANKSLFLHTCCAF